MSKRDDACPECGQLFSVKPIKCPHCGFQFCAVVDHGRVSDLVPGFRRLPYGLRKAIMLIVAFFVVAYIVDLPEQLDQLHRFMSRRGLPHWMTR